MSMSTKWFMFDSWQFWNLKSVSFRVQTLVKTNEKPFELLMWCDLGMWSPTRSLLNTHSHLKKTPRGSQLRMRARNRITSDCFLPQRRHGDSHGLRIFWSCHMLSPSSMPLFWNGFCTSPSMKYCRSEAPLLYATTLMPTAEPSEHSSTAEFWAPHFFQVLVCAHDSSVPSNIFKLLKVIVQLIVFVFVCLMFLELR